jgi:hypothetical protein
MAFLRRGKRSERCWKVYGNLIVSIPNGDGPSRPLPDFVFCRHSGHLGFDVFLLPRALVTA